MLTTFGKVLFRYSRWRYTVVVPVVVALATHVVDGAEETTSPEKLAPPVRHFLNSRREDKLPVLVIGTEQMLAGPQAFEQFCEEHAGRKRSEVRQQVIRRLKSIADDQQSTILDALDSPEGSRRAWIVNAVWATLSAEQIRTARDLDEVRLILVDWPTERDSEPGIVCGVIQHDQRRVFSTIGKTIPWNLKQIEAPRVWEELKVTGRGVVVAMFDLGVNYMHEDLMHSIWVNRDEVPNNGRDDDGNGYVDDLYGYNVAQDRAEVFQPPFRSQGTWAAGIVAGDGSSGIVTGVAPEARLMVVQGMGSHLNAILACQYALENGADVMNMSSSLGNLGEVRSVWRLMCEQAVCGGLVLVSAAGDLQQSRPAPEQIRVPASIPCVICAGGVDAEGQVPDFGSLGPVEWASVDFYGDYPMPDGCIKPDVCGLPGPDYPLLNARADGGYLPTDHGICGNSLAAAHVAGVAALVLSAAPETLAWDVKKILEATATDIDPPGKDNQTGSGLLNAYQAVRAAR